jgi:hypothetical protein
LAPSVEEMPDLQRLSLIGTVFYVHQDPKRAVPRPLLVSEAPEVEASLLAAQPSDADAEETTDTEESEPVALSEAPEPGTDSEASESVAGLDPQRPVPRGFAVEFGTGRMIPLQYTPDGFQMIPPRSRGHM